MESISYKSTVSETNSENSFKAHHSEAEYRLLKVIGKGTYSNVYFCQKQNNEAPNTRSSRQSFSANDDLDLVSKISDFDLDYDEIDLSDYQTTRGFYKNFQALKTIQKPNLHKKGVDYNVQKAMFMNESKVLKAIQGHPNIVKLVENIPSGYVESKAKHEKLHIDFAMAIECLPGGELSLNMFRVGRYPNFVAHYFFNQVTKAIAHMHSKGYCHRDLKPWNIMLNEHLDSVRVIDFSYSIPFDKVKQEKVPEFLRGFLDGTKQFMAPEQLNKECFPLTDDFSKIDVWALGVTLVHMLTLKLPFANDGLTVMEDIETYQAFVDDPASWLVTNGADLSDQELKDASDLLKEMLVFEKKDRISVAQVLKSNYVTNYHKAITK